MISTQKLLYKIDMRLNKKVSNEHQSIPLEDKILALNEAQISLIKQKIDINNLYGLGLDAFKKRYEDLQPLVVSFEKLTVTPTSDIYDAFQADLTTLSHKYMIPLDAYVLCTKGTCKEHPVYIPRPVKHGDISTLMFNPHYAPSFEYQESFCVISANKYVTYTDGTFTVNDLYLSYLRYPVSINYIGYIDFDGNPSTTVDCELPDYLENELLNLACMELGMDTENTPAVQYTAEYRNKTSE